LIYSVLVTASPENVAVHKEAIRFCNKVFESGHEVNQVFFMHHATKVAVNDLSKEWVEMSRRHQFTLQTCSTTAESLGIKLPDYEDGFLSAGTSSFADALLSSDQLKQFDESL